MRTFRFVHQIDLYSEKFVYSRFFKYKGSLKKYKGKSNLNFIAQNTSDLFIYGSSYLRPAFLRCRRVERHPYWQNCMHIKLYEHAIFDRIACTCNCACNFWWNAIVPIWVSFNLSGLQECCPRRWIPQKSPINCILRDKDKIGFPFYFFKFNFLYTKFRVQFLILQHKACYYEQL